MRFKHDMWPPRYIGISTSVVGCKNANSKKNDTRDPHHNEHSNGNDEPCPELFEACFMMDNDKLVGRLLRNMSQDDIRRLGCVCRATYERWCKRPVCWFVATCCC